ncbi:hypothetical protein MVEN_00014600 [Mycena venus]|uniref:Uncharacterized protein n=1 Tax=Mycena venus TaxID=2733690 RepID=A0A8H7DFV5_9AGAR|nr:hypothetical protein MVEN_00014600 [Mycena venus]
MKVKDVSLDELGACNNPRCPAGCGWYQPTPFKPDVSIAMTPCIICGCVAGQHRESVRPTSTPNPVPQAGPSFNSVPSSASTVPTSDFTFVPPAEFPSDRPSNTSTVPKANFASQGGSAFSSGPSGAAKQPGASTSFSATARTMFGSRTESVASSSQRGRSPLRGSTAAPHSFRNVADLRQKDIRAAMRTSAPFHPAMKSSKKRKRRDDASPSRERNVKSKVAPAKPYVAVVVPFTKEINRGHCSVPAAHLLVRLDDARYVKDILISSDDTGEDIRTKILIAFSDIEPLVEYGFRLLFVHRKMKLDRHGNMVPKPGVPRILRTGKRELDFTAIKRALSDSNVRLSGPRFKRIIFLAVNPAGPNLPLRGFAYDNGDDLDYDLSSDELSQSSESGAEASDTTMDDVDDAKSDDQMGESTEKESHPDRKGKKKASDEGSRFDTGFFDDDVAAGVHYDSDSAPHQIPEPKIEKPVVPQAQLTVVRLLKNMEKPELKPSRPTSFVSSHSEIICPLSDIAFSSGRKRVSGVFVLGTKSSEICAGVLVQFLASPETSVLSAPQILSFIESNICQPFSMLTKLGGYLRGKIDRLGTPEFEAEFDSSFAIGPGGLHGLIPHILPAYLALPVAVQAGASADAASAVYDNLTEMSYALLRCLRHLRFKHHRSLWDPRGGFRELATILMNKDADLPVATEEDFRRLNWQLLIDALAKDHPSVSEVSFLLMDFLGDASNPRQMTAERVIKGGEYGMLRFYTLIVAPILDDLDAAHPDYLSLFGSVQTACAGIARKIRNYFKSGGANANNASSSSGPNTRSRSKRTTGSFDSNVDDMTNTDSLESGWEKDCSGGGPDIAARRAKRRAKAHHSKPEPCEPEPEPEPIVITSDSDDRSDSEWRRTYAKWKKNAHVPPRQPSQPPSPSDFPSSTPGPARPTGPSQTRAQPAWIDPQALESDDIEDATGLLSRPTTRYWQGVIREVLERFPHPDTTRQLTMDTLLAPGMTRTRQYRLLFLTYHPDRNVNGTAHWLRVAGIISQILNATRTSKLDDPCIVPPEDRF